MQPPATGAAIGEYVGPPSPTLEAGIQYREGQLGRTLAIALHYYDWTDPFPGTMETADANAGRVPMDAWHGTDLTSINNGSQDSLIKKRAAAIKAYGKPIMLRFAWEMNGNWFPWDAVHNGNDPAAYIAAWRHVHDLFAAADVTNVSWVWAPNDESIPGSTNVTSWNNWRNFYPGDDYVDWVGIDGYNRGSTTGDGWQSFGQLFGPVYADYAGRKPIIIAETGSVEAGGSKAAWIADMGNWAKSHPGIKAIVWFDTKMTNDFSIDTSQSSMDAFKTLTADPYFSAMFH